MPKHQRTNTSANISKADDATQEVTAELRELWRKLQAATDSVAAVQRLRESARMQEAARIKRLTYPSTQDELLVQMETRLREMQGEVAQMARGYDCTDAVVDWDSDETVVEPYMIETDLNEVDQDAMKPGQLVMVEVVDVNVTDDRCKMGEAKGADTVIKSVKERLDAPHKDALWRAAEFLTSVIGDADRRVDAVPTADVAIISEAVNLVVTKIAESELTLDTASVIQSLHHSIVRVRHTTLKDALSSSKEVLQRFIATFPETIGGMRRMIQSARRDREAQTCFALVVEMLCAKCDRDRFSLIDKLSLAIQRVLWPRFALRRAAARKKNKAAWVVAWAGRVLLLCVHVLAYMVSKYGRHKKRRLVHMLDALSERHAVFPQLLKRARCMLEQQVIPTAMLSLHHESRHIIQTCKRTELIQ